MPNIEIKPGDRVYITVHYGKGIVSGYGTVASIHKKDVFKRTSGYDTRYLVNLDSGSRQLVNPTEITLAEPALDINKGQER